MNLHSLETSVLLEMLAAHTSDYTKMLTEGNYIEEDFAKCSLTIKAIQAEIDFRKQTSSNTSTTDPNIVIPDEG